MAGIYLFMMGYNIELYWYSFFLLMNKEKNSEKNIFRKKKFSRTNIIKNKQLNEQKKNIQKSFQATLSTNQSIH